MTEKIITEIDNYIRTFVESCSTNFTDVWTKYMRVRVSVKINKPLKRKMKVRKSGAEWFWITFKYENFPTFYFICGIMGHSDKFYSRLLIRQRKI